MKELYELILESAIFYDAQMNETRVKMFAKALSDLPLDQVKLAYSEMYKDPERKKIPLPAEIRNYISPKLSNRDEAILIARKIESMIRRKGSTWRSALSPTWPATFTTTGGQIFDNIDDALIEELGDTGHFVVQSYGFHDLVSDFKEMPSGQFYPQMRDTVLAVIEAKKKENRIPALTSAEQKLIT